MLFDHIPPLESYPYGDEEWRPVVGYEDYYAVSSYGRVMRTRTAKGATVGRILKSNPSGRGYPGVCLHKNRESRFRTCHVLVAESFLGARPDGFKVNHKDGDKANSHLSNLEYVTVRENNRHALKMGLKVSVGGTDTSRTARLSREQVAEIRASSESALECAKRFGVSKKHIYEIRRGHVWKDGISMADRSRSQQFDYGKLLKRQDALHPDVVTLVRTVVIEDMIADAEDSGAMVDLYGDAGDDVTSRVSLVEWLRDHHFDEAERRQEESGYAIKLADFIKSEIERAA